MRTVPCRRASTASSAVGSSQVWATIVIDTSANPAAVRSWVAVGRVGVAEEVRAGGQADVERPVLRDGAEDGREGR